MPGFVKRSVLFRLSLAFFAVFLGVRWANTQFTKSNVVGKGNVANRPDTSNSVSTKTNVTENHVSPIPLDRPAASASSELVATIREMPRSRIIKHTNSYIHAEFRSLLFAFVDDVEIEIDEDEGLIHLRSASRVGVSDLGVNKIRIAAIRTRFTSRK